MGYQLQGRLLEVCSCNTLCPCWVGDDPDGGTCDTAVMGFTCTEGARQSVPGVQFNATADCSKGEAEIKSSYTQNF